MTIDKQSKKCFFFFQNEWEPTGQTKRDSRSHTTFNAKKRGGGCLITMFPIASLNRKAVNKTDEDSRSYTRLKTKNKVNNIGKKQFKKSFLFFETRIRVDNQSKN